MDIVSDTYIRGGIPQSRYCRSCAHYQVLSGCSNSGGEPGARACLYILDTGHRRGCLPGPGCDKHITFAQWREASAAAPSCGRSTAIAAQENGGQHHDD